jgi:hypothetical protein
MNKRLTQYEITQLHRLLEQAITSGQIEVQANGDTLQGWNWQAEIMMEKDWDETLQDFVGPEVEVAVKITIDQNTINFLLK